MNTPSKEPQGNPGAHEEDSKWGSVLNELDVELTTLVTAMEFDDEWTRPEVNDD